jgi:hypothetical protein
MAVVTMRRTSASSLTSALIGMAPIFVAAARSVVSLRAEIATRPPRWMRSCAVARPIPLLPPVTRARMDVGFMGCRATGVKQVG